MHKQRVTARRTQSKAATLFDSLLNFLFIFFFFGSRPLGYLPKCLQRSTILDPTKNNAQQRPLLVKGNITLQANRENRKKRRRTNDRKTRIGGKMLENICISFAKQKA